MIAKSKNPTSPDVNILFDNVEVDYTSIVGFEMFLDENNHDLCIIKMRGIHPRAITDYVDAGVRVLISNGAGRRQEFCGYVSYVEAEAVSRDGLINRSPFQDANIICLGASSVMKGKKQKVWENVSIGILAQELATEYGFSLDVNSRNYQYPRLIQQSESDWEFLVRVAKLYGCRVTVHGTHMHVWDPHKAIGRLPSYHILSTSRSAINNIPGIVMSFRGTFGYETNEGRSADYVITSTSTDGTITTVKSDPNLTETWTGYEKKKKYVHELPSTAQNPAEAQAVLEQLDKEFYAFNAEMEVLAGAGIVPGGVVDLREYNSNFDRLWYVRSVKHKMGSSQYTTELCVARDFNEENKFDMQTMESFGEVPDPVFVNGKWKSSDPRVSKYV